jgi:hypothetical protein
LLRDAVAITDLAAGCLVDTLGACERAAEGALWVRPTATLTRKAEVILDWFTQQGHALRRVVICLEASDKGGVDVSVFQSVRASRGQVFLLR